MTTLYVPVKGRVCGRLRKVGWHKTGSSYQGAGQHRKGGAGPCKAGGFETLPALLHFYLHHFSPTRHLLFQQS